MSRDRPVVLVLEGADRPSRRRSSLEDCTVETDFDPDRPRADLADVDVALVDGEVPRATREALLSAASPERADVMVAFVTEGDPEVDLLADGYDDYVPASVTGAELRALIGDLLDREEHTDDVEAYHDLLAEREALAGSLPEPEAHERYREVDAEIRAIEAHLEDDRERLVDDAAFVSTIRELDREGEDA